MACVLTLCATVMCLVNVLDTPRLTAIANRAANRMLDADVSLGRVELSLMRHLPFLRVGVDSVTVLSGPMMRLQPHDRALLPQWSDTLLTIGHFHGGIDVTALLLGKIALHDVVLDRPEVNIVMLNDSVSNYMIYKSAPDTTAGEQPAQIPHISISSFRIERPRPLRYHNARTGDNLTVTLKPVNLDGAAAPMYVLELGGNVSSPLLSPYNLGDLPFGIGGGIAWDPEKAGEIELRDFVLSAAFINARVNGHMDFENDIELRDYDLSLGKVGVERLLEVLPDSLRRAWSLVPDRFGTDMAVSLTARSTGSFNLTRDTIPHADIELTLHPGRLTYGRARLTRVGGRFAASLKGNDLGAATFTVSDFNVAGPATDLTVNATVSDVTTDPLVKGTLRGHTRLSRLPAQVATLVKGVLGGTIDADISFAGRPSMLTRNSFHRLRIDGDIDAGGLYYLANDTGMRVYAREACFRFGTNSKVSVRDGSIADSLLTMSLRVDSAAVSTNDLSMRFTDFKLGAGASNRRASTDTTAVVPMGGGLDLGSFHLTVRGDSTVFDMRDAHGRVGMRRYRGDSRRPQFGLDIRVGRILAGTADTRMMLIGSEIHAAAHKLPRRPLPPKIKATADSIHKQNPGLPMDSVYRYAIRKHRRPGRRTQRTAPEYTELEAEIINLGSSKTLRRMLLQWQIDGTVSSRRAGLFTPYFPIRNRVRDFNMRFNNDSIVLSDVRYKAGHSDFMISGQISNLKRGFTSRGFRSPLKINFEVSSDTIDVNELASSTFRGAAYAADTTRAPVAGTPGMAALDNVDASGDASFEREMGRYVDNASDSTAPLLIPRNIDLRFDIKARNVLYSDLLFHDLNGELLAYRGAINLHHMRASSEVGRINLSALYSATTPNDLKFGFGMKVNDFNMESFTRLVPALDTIMPLLHDLKGTVNADIAATCDLDREMNFNLPTLSAAIKLEGDSLVLIDKETYRKIGRWLLFKDKQSNIINRMNVELTISDNHMQLYPFMFDLDRYRLGVQGHNDLALNFDYHISVLKSPLPFKFGINLTGNPDKFKVRLGRARFNEKSAARTVSIVDTARVNLLNQIENIFRRGVANSRFARVDVGAKRSDAADINLAADTISHADSLVFIKEGLIPAPPQPESEGKADKDKKNRKRKKSKDTSAVFGAILPEDPTIKFES